MLKDMKYLGFRLLGYVDTIERLKIQIDQLEEQLEICQQNKT